MLKFVVNTCFDNHIIDVTKEIQEIVKESKIQDGLCTVYIPHTTAGITINENADEDVKHDILKEINKIVPLEDDYLHAEGNSAAHLKASIFGFSQTIIIENGELQLGTWQGIYFCEFDGPRTREVCVKIIG